MNACKPLILGQGQVTRRQSEQVEEQRRARQLVVQEVQVEDPEAAGRLRKLEEVGGTDEVGLPLARRAQHRLQGFAQDGDLVTARRKRRGSAAGFEPADDGEQPPQPQAEIRRQSPGAAQKHQAGGKAQAWQAPAHAGDRQEHCRQRHPQQLSAYVPMSHGSRSRLFRDSRPLARYRPWPPALEL